MHVGSHNRLQNRMACASLLWSISWDTSLPLPFETSIYELRTFRHKCYSYHCESRHMKLFRQREMSCAWGPCGIEGFFREIYFTPEREYLALIAGLQITQFAYSGAHTLWKTKGIFYREKKKLKENYSYVWPAEKDVSALASTSPNVNATPRKRAILLGQ